jgi:hypothetical protein
MQGFKITFAALTVFLAATPMLQAMDDSAMGGLQQGADASKGVQVSIDKGDMGGASQTATTAFDKIASGKQEGSAVSAGSVSQHRSNLVLSSSKSMPGMKGLKVPAPSEQAVSKQDTRKQIVKRWAGGAAAVGGLAGGIFGLSGSMYSIAGGLASFAAGAALFGGAAAIVVGGSIIAYYVVKDTLNKDAKSASPVK